MIFKQVPQVPHDKELLFSPGPLLPLLLTRVFCCKNVALRALPKRSNYYITATKLGSSQPPGRDLRTNYYLKHQPATILGPSRSKNRVEKKNSNIKIADLKKIAELAVLWRLSSGSGAELSSNHYVLGGFVLRHE